MRPMPRGSESLPPGRPLPRHAQLVLMGDFLSPLPAIEAALRPHAERGVKGHLLMVADPAEESLPFLGRVRFEGLEVGRRAAAEPGRIRP